MLSSLDEQRTEDLVVGFPYFEHAPLLIRGLTHRRTGAGHIR